MIKDLNSAGVTKYLVSASKYTLEKSGEWNLRIKEHQRDIRLKYATQLALSEYNIKTRHQILFDKTIITSNITSYFPKKYREAIEIQNHPNNLNRDNGYNINRI